MAPLIPRFEFRLFAQHFGEAEQWLRQQTESGALRESEESYILSRKTNRMNAKIRFNSLDIKELLDVDDGLELWYPRLKMEFPVTGEMVEDEVLPLLGVQLAIRFDELNIEEFLEKVVFTSQDLLLAQIRKRRQAYVMDNCLVELADVLVNGAFIRTLGLESEDKEALAAAIKSLGLEGRENINYQLALKRITGLAQWPNHPDF